MPTGSGFLMLLGKLLRTAGALDSESVSAPHVCLDWTSVHSPLSTLFLQQCKLPTVNTVVSLFLVILSYSLAGVLASAVGRVDFLVTGCSEPGLSDSASGCTENTAFACVLGHSTLVVCTDGSASSY